jgi:hypothetical protein
VIRKIRGAEGLSRIRVLGEEQYNRLKDQIDGQVAGTGNAARPLLL